MSLILILLFFFNHVLGEGSAAVLLITLVFFFSSSSEADLRVGEVQWGDSGVYTCKVVISDDLEGQNEASVELLVLGKLRWFWTFWTSRSTAAQEKKVGALSCGRRCDSGMQDISSLQIKDFFSRRAAVVNGWCSSPMIPTSQVHWLQTINCIHSNYSFIVLESNGCRKSATWKWIDDVTFSGLSPFVCVHLFYASWGRCEEGKTENGPCNLQCRCTCLMLPWLWLGVCALSWCSDLLWRWTFIWLAHWELMHAHRRRSCYVSNHVYTHLVQMLVRTPQKKEFEYHSRQITSFHALVCFVACRWCKAACEALVSP